MSSCWRSNRQPVEAVDRKLALLTPNHGKGCGDAERGRLCLGVGDAHGLGNTGRTLLALDLDGPLVCHANAAVWHVVGGEQLLAAAYARTNLHGVGETHFVRA